MSVRTGHVEVLDKDGVTDNPTGDFQTSHIDVEVGFCLLSFCARVFVYFLLKVMNDVFLYHHDVRCTSDDFQPVRLYEFIQILRCSF